MYGKRGARSAYRGSTHHDLDPTQYSSYNSTQLAAQDLPVYAWTDPEDAASSHCSVDDMREDIDSLRRSLNQLALLQS